MRFYPCKQHTLAKPVTIRGIGIHSGIETSVSIAPAPEGSGTTFVLEHADDISIPARWDFVVDTKLCTVLGRPTGQRLATVEHLMAALWGAGVDNATVTVQGHEIPILDGSAQTFFDAINQVGLQSQSLPRRGIRVLRPVRVTHGDAWLEISPCESFKISLDVPLTGQTVQHFQFDAARHGFEDVAPARTFSHLDQVKQMQAAGFIKGGSLDNAVVLDGERVLNPEGLRFKDECARHKTLDLIGDLALAGAPLLGQVRGHRPGHTVNQLLLKTLMQQDDAWAYVDVPAVSKAYHPTSVLFAAKQSVAVFETSAYN